MEACLLNTASDAALLDLLKSLRDEGYSFTCVTPATHARVIRRKGNAASLRDVFGWSLAFEESLLPPRLLELLRTADALEQRGRLFKSKLRVTSLGDLLLLHSAFPTSDRDAVFFGPDTYRFASLVRRELPRLGQGRRIVDIGAGTGAGGLVAAQLAPGARLTLSDVNPSALRLSALNAAFAGVEAEHVEGSGLEAVEGEIDLVLANPPYIMDGDQRAYRDGGGMHGGQLSFDWAVAAAKRLRPGGHMILYTGTAIVDGVDALGEALRDALPRFDCSLRYEELDPDIFGEELDKAPYREVERIAAVAAVIGKDGG